MRYSGIIKNDFSSAPGVCVTVFVQGCPFRCHGCHNPETWSFNGGKEFNSSVLEEIFQALTANNIHRNFCIMGGEPLCKENLPLTALLVEAVRTKFPNIKIYVWTGYVYEELLKDNDAQLKNIISQIDCLIDGPYIESERDITLKMRGSRNQRIIDL